MKSCVRLNAKKIPTLINFRQEILLVHDMNRALMWLQNTAHFVATFAGIFMLACSLLLMLLERYYIACSVGALGFALISGIVRISDRRDNQGMEECKAELAKRPPVDLPAEMTGVAQRNLIPIADVDRLWRGLAAMYGVSPDRIRAADEILRDLRGLVEHPDYDPYDSRVVMLAEGLRPFPVCNITTWGDLVAALYRAEQDSGLLGTRVVDVPSGKYVLWDGVGQQFATNHCQECGYNLRGLIDSRCPECGRIREQ